MRVGPAAALSITCLCGGCALIDGLSGMPPDDSVIDPALLPDCILEPPVEQTIELGYSGPSLAVGDVDRDGQDDVVAATAASGGTQAFELLVLRGNGAGLSPAEVIEGVQASRIGLGDLDGDGRADLVASIVDGPPRAWFGQATPPYLGETTLPGDAMQPVVDLSFGAFEAGRLDVVLYTHESELYRLRAAGGSLVRASGSTVWDPQGEVGQPGALATGDFDGDVRDDVVVGSWEAYPLWFFVNEGDDRLGQFKTGLLRGTLHEPYPPGALATGDLDEDGKDDIVWQTRGERMEDYRVRLYTSKLGEDWAMTRGGDQGPTGQGGRTLTTSGFSLQFADFTAGGHLDLVMSTMIDGQNVLVLLGDGHGNFNCQHLITLAGGAPLGPLALGQFGGTELLDIVAWVEEDLVLALR